MTAELQLISDRNARIDDPVWEERIRRLVTLTTRSSVIRELTGLDASRRMFSTYINRLQEECGDDTVRSRGEALKHTSNRFLATMADRFDAAYLLNLHFGTKGLGPTAGIETDLGSALDKMLEVYIRYRSQLYERASDARVTFEEYVIMIDAIKKREIGVHVCGECSSRYMTKTTLIGQNVCTVCGHLNLNVAQARKTIERLIADRKARKNAPAKQRAAAV